MAVEVVGGPGEHGEVSYACCTFRELCPRPSQSPGISISFPGLLDKSLGKLSLFLVSLIHLGAHKRNRILKAGLKWFEKLQSANILDQGEGGRKRVGASLLGRGGPANS